MRKQYDQELDNLHNLLVEMGNMCQEAIFMAAHILQEEDPDVEAVEEKEKAIDKKEREIEHLCMHLILRQQPIASDLRRIGAALKMITDMERIGDQAADIADLARFIAGKEKQGESQGHLWEMAQATVKMVTDSVASFVNDDYDLALQVMKADDAVDTLFEKIKKDIIDMIRTQQVDAEGSLDLLMAAKYFERIGDHAVNIAEWVEYSITGGHENKED
ncbi:MAG TPA: phosphate signaling complex protein PhoU [Candidatus Scybalocola faecigallinarum]|uniref:Phosphate-specific transport system accessory protein PhoU n=1 Tax=Candidatus Scybalocola faecigallinarum TaxID=2840941 RepID=A0A9D1F2U0_9FIRM|nr:phosphate signaling complex protein PhoU [Candidatus Scybalocola faecigallinarum]